MPVRSTTPLLDLTTTGNPFKQDGARIVNHTAGLRGQTRRRKEPRRKASIYWILVISYEVTRPIHALLNGFASPGFKSETVTDPSPRFPSSSCTLIWIVTDFSS